MSERSLGRGRLRRLVDADGRVVYQADFTDAAGKRRRICVAGDRATGERVLAKIIRERDLELAGMGGEKGIDLAVADLVAQYLAELTTRCKPRHVTETRKILTRLTDEMALILVRDVTRPRVTAWRQRRSREGASNKTINNATAALLAVLNFAVSLGQLPANPLTGLKALPITAIHQRRRPRALSEVEIGALLSAAADYDRKHSGLVPRLPLLTFLIGTGARWGETVATRWGDLDLEGGSIVLRAETTKTQATRTLPLHQDVLGALRGLHALETERLGHAPFRGDPIFRTPEGAPWGTDGRNFRRYMHALLKLARIPYRDATGRVVHIHALRHTFATRLARAGVGVATAQRLTGHRTAAMLLQIYTHVSADDAREAIRSLPGVQMPRGMEALPPSREAESA